MSDCLLNDVIITVNPFDAADSPSSIQLDESGAIKAATLEKLIEKLTTFQYSSMVINVKYIQLSK